MMTRRIKGTIYRLTYTATFQYNHHIKPDYCNTGGLQVWDENEKDWCDWHGEGTNDYYDDVDDYIESHDDASEFEEFTRELLSQVTFD